MIKYQNILSLFITLYFFGKVEHFQKIRQIKSRSEFNHFAFQVSNPITIFFRDIALKFLSKNNSFLEGYLGKVYR